MDTTLAEDELRETQDRDWVFLLLYYSCNIVLYSYVRRTRHAGHCWRSRDELIRDVLLWIPTHGRAKAGRPARTYIQQLCEDTGCCPEDLPRAINDREEWRERVRDIRATSAIWWCWWWYSYVLSTIFYWFRSFWTVNFNYTYIINIIYIYMCVCVCACV